MEVRQFSFPIFFRSVELSSPTDTNMQHLQVKTRLQKGQKDNLTREPPRLPETLSAPHFFTYFLPMIVSTHQTSLRIDARLNASNGSKWLEKTLMLKSNT